MKIRKIELKGLSLILRHLKVETKGGKKCMGGEEFHVRYAQ